MTDKAPGCVHPTGHSGEEEGDLNPHGYKKAAPGNRNGKDIKKNQHVSALVKLTHIRQESLTRCGFSGASGRVQRLRGENR